MNILPMTLIRSGGLPLDSWAPMVCSMPDWDALEHAEHQSAAMVLQAFDSALSHLEPSLLRTSVYNARKSFFQRKKMPAPALMQSFEKEPFMSELLERLLEYEHCIRQQYAARTQFEQFLSANYHCLQEIAGDENLQKALLFASHDLLAGLIPFVAKKKTELDKKDRRRALSLLQYVSRMVFKTSPLGRFTTVQISPLSFESAEPDEQADWPATKTQITPNVAFLPELYAVLLQEAVFYKSLKIKLNGSVSFATGSTISWLYFDGEREAFQAMEPDPVLEFLMDKLLENGRMMLYSVLSDQLRQEVDASETALKALLFRLIDIGLLEWELPEKGLSPGWCGSLYQYLGQLPAETLIAETAALLQWIRGAARVMPFQALDDARQLQKQSLEMLNGFLEKHGATKTPIPPEQVFFEDMVRDIPQSLPAGILEQLTGQLAGCWQQKPLHVLPVFRSRIHVFAQETMSPGESLDFLEFCRKFMAYKPDSPTAQVKGPRYDGKLGALLQVYQDKGVYKAVVNAMYPGGGKLFARWLPLYASRFTDQLKAWRPKGDILVLNFPWQGWSNANFQPMPSGPSLSVPDGRAENTKAGTQLFLSDLAVFLTPEGVPELRYKPDGQTVQFTDLGLEAPETRPPMIQILWHLGVPSVSSEALLPEGGGWEKRAEIYHRNRLEYRSLVLAREAWELPEKVWTGLFTAGASETGRLIAGIRGLKALGIPQRFFAQFTKVREKPRFFDLDCPLSIVLLEKTLRSGAGPFRLTEMLPLPGQWLGNRVGEYVVEFEPG